MPIWVNAMPCVGSKLAIVAGTGSNFSLELMRVWRTHVLFGDSMTYEKARLWHPVMLHAQSPRSHVNTA